VRSVNKLSSVALVYNIFNSINITMTILSQLPLSFRR
jgi:hypothetical protein